MVAKKKLELTAKKYNWKTASFLEIINMSDRELQHVHPYSFEQLQTMKEATYKNPLSVSLALVLPDNLILKLNEYQLSTFPNLVLADYSKQTVELLYDKFKDTIVDYQEDMFYKHQGLNLGERLLTAMQVQKNRKKTIKSFYRGIDFFKVSGMISLSTLANLLKITDYKGITSYKYLNDLKEVLEKYEIEPKNKPLYEELKEKEDNTLYNYDEIKKWIFKNYRGYKNENNLLELYRFKDILSYFVKEGYLTTANQKLNEETFMYLRYGDFPSINISLRGNEYKLYFLSEIEEYVQKFQKTNIIPIETPLNKERINKIGIR